MGDKNALVSDAPPPYSVQPGLNTQPAYSPEPGFQQPYNPQPGFQQPYNPQPGFQQTYNPQPGFQQAYSPQPGFQQPYGPQPGQYTGAGDPKVESNVIPPQQTIVFPTLVAAVGPEPANLTCPSCHAVIQTSVVAQENSKTHTFAFLLCIFGCWPCCLIPYCMDSCKSMNHYCPNCKAFIGSYSN